MVKQTILAILFSIACLSHQVNGLEYRVSTDSESLVQIVKKLCGSARELTNIANANQISQPYMVTKGTVIRMKCEGKQDPVQTTQASTSASAKSTLPTSQTTVMPTSTSQTSASSTKPSQPPSTSPKPPPPPPPPIRKPSLSELYRLTENPNVYPEKTKGVDGDPKFGQYKSWTFSNLEKCLSSLNGLYELYSLGQISVRPRFAVVREIDQYTYKCTYFSKDFSNSPYVYAFNKEKVTTYWI